MQNKRKLLIAILINLTIFVTVNIMCNMKYEQVDDFMIYNLYSGLDGTYNMHGIYIHPAICFILGLFFRVIPTVNWHSIFLLSIQFICFTSIGYIILKKSNDIRVMNLYIICDSIFYSTLLIMIQYTSVAALALLTSFLLLIDMIEQKENKSKKESECDKDPCLDVNKDLEKQHKKNGKTKRDNIKKNRKEAEKSTKKLPEPSQLPSPSSLPEPTTVPKQKSGSSNNDNNDFIDLTQNDDGSWDFPDQDKKNKKN